MPKITQIYLSVFAYAHILIRAYYYVICLKRTCFLVLSISLSHMYIEYA